jgi:Bacterial transcriptional activator domain
MLHGPHNRIRVLAASARRGVDLVRNCPLLAEFGTRLVLRAADEEESIALLGSVDATELGGGGHLLARIEGRVPFQVLGYRVASDRLAQLVTLIAEHASATDWWVSRCTDHNEADSSGPAVRAARTPEALTDGIHAHEPPSAVDPNSLIKPRLEGLADAVDPSSNEVNQEHPARDVSPDVQAELPLDLHTGSEAGEHRNGTSRERPPEHAVTVSKNESTGSGDVTNGRGASTTSTAARARLQARFLGARELLYDGQLVWPPAGAPDEAAMELLVFLGLQDPSGVRADLLSDSLWEEDDEDDEDRSYRLRKRRYRLRRALKRFIPGWQGDPIARMDKQNPVYRLDPTIIESDVHCFLRLLEEARSLSREEAIDAYEKALGLYRGDLLERPDVPSYRWLDDGPRVLDLRVKYATMHQRARRKLADLLATGCTDDKLARAHELYVGLGETDPLDHRLWEALARLHGRRNDLLGLEATFRRPRSAVVELGDGDDPDRVRIPPALRQVFEEVRDSLLAGRAE